MRANGDVSAQSHQELVNGGKLFWCPNIERDRAGVKHGRVVLVRVGKGVQALCHLAVVGRSDTTLLDVGEELIHAVVMRAFQPGSNGSIVAA